MQIFKKLDSEDPSVKNQNLSTESVPRLVFSKQICFRNYHFLKIKTLCRPKFEHCKMPYSEVPDKQACSLSFFGFFFHHTFHVINEIFYHTRVYSCK